MTLAGLRPGEKLFEEKLMAEEGLKKTKNKLIHMSDEGYEIFLMDLEDYKAELEEEDEE